MYESNKTQKKKGPRKGKSRVAIAAVWLPKFGSAFDVCSIDYEEFIESAPTDYVIFDYGSKRDPRSFVRAPVSGIDDYWFDAEPTASVAFKKRFEALWDRGTQHRVGVDAKRA